MSNDILEKHIKANSPQRKDNNPKMKSHFDYDDEEDDVAKEYEERSSNKKTVTKVIKINDSRDKNGNSYHSTDN